MQHKIKCRYCDYTINYWLGRGKQATGKLFRHVQTAHLKEFLEAQGCESLDELLKRDDMLEELDNSDY